jgi:hypothetical protein
MGHWCNGSTSALHAERGVRLPVCPLMKLFNESGQRIYYCVFGYLDDYWSFYSLKNPITKAFLLTVYEKYQEDVAQYMRNEDAGIKQEWPKEFTERLAEMGVFELDRDEA